MKQNNNFRFSVSLSTLNFQDKEISNAMIGSCNDKSNKEIKKKYNLPLNRGLEYTVTELTAKELLDKCINGYVFCNLFNTPKPTFSRTKKRDENFLGSYVVCADIEETKYTSVENFVKNLTHKPTIYYTTYSNYQLRTDGTNKGARFRLVYVFEELIKSKYFFKYCADQIYKEIEQNTSEEIHDKCGNRCSQYFNGTNLNNESLTVSFGISNNIYSFSDFKISDSGYAEYLRSGAGYKTMDKKRKSEISKILRSGDYISEMVDTDLSIPEDTVKIDKELIKKLTKMRSLDNFLKSNRKKYNYSYTYRTEPTDWIDGIYQFTKKGDFMLPYTVNGYQKRDGQKRRKTIYMRMCLRRLINPELTPEQLLISAVEDRERFFNNSDNVLSIECLQRNVESAFRLTLDEIENEYSETLAKLRSNCPKVIFRTNTSLDNSSSRNKYIRDNILYPEIEKYYNHSLTVRENLEILK